MSPYLHDFLVVWVASAIAMTALWAWQWRTRNAGYVDAAWAALLACAAMYYGAVSEGGLWPRMLVAILAAFWGFRLALHVLNRVLHEVREDGRYAHLRAHWQGNQWKFFVFFQAQAASVVLFSVPFHAVADHPSETLTPWMLLGAALFVISLCGESVADWQLARFKRDPAHRGKTCRVGLWAYSRHPNYFFEWLHWLSYVLMAVGSPGFLWSWIGPVLMLLSLCWVTGIPYVEAQSLRSRGDDYRRYQREVSAFVPWFPKR